MVAVEYRRLQLGRGDHQVRCLGAFQVIRGVFRVIQRSGCGDQAVLVVVYQAEVVATSLGVYFTILYCRHPGCRRWMPVRIA
jgi:hypothetical protein